MKQQINNAYDVDNVLALENELTHNRQIIDKLMSQNKGLKNVKKGQSQAMKWLNHDSDANQRLDNIKQDLADTKREVKGKIEHIRTKEKHLQEKQKRMVDLEERYRKLEMMLLKNKQKTRRKDETSISMSQLNTQPEDDIKEPADSLSKQKYEDEAKYTQLHTHYEHSIQKLHDELLQKEGKLRDEFRIKQHNKRIQQLNTFYKKKKLKDEIQRKRDEDSIRKYQDLLSHKMEPMSIEQELNTNDLHSNIIAEEKSRFSDDSRTQDFYKASSDDEDKSKSKSPKKSAWEGTKKSDLQPPQDKRQVNDKANEKSLQNKREADEISDQILRNIASSAPKDKPIASQRAKPSQNEKFGLNVVNGNISTTPIKNEEVSLLNYSRPTPSTQTTRCPS